MRIRPSILLLALFAASASASASDSWRDIPPAEGRRFSVPDSVSVRGAWKAQGDYAKPRIAKVNDSAIVCVRESMRCIESLASIIPLRGQADASPPQLLAITAEYAIKEWSDQRIVATRVNPRGLPIYSTLMIPLGQGNVRLDWRAAEDDGWFVPAVQSFEIEVKQAF